MGSMLPYIAYMDPMGNICCKISLSSIILYIIEIEQQSHLPFIFKPAPWLVPNMCIHGFWCLSGKGCSDQELGCYPKNAGWFLSWKIIMENPNLIDLKQMIFLGLANYDLENHPWLGTILVFTLIKSFTEILGGRLRRFVGFRNGDLGHSWGLRCVTLIVIYRNSQKNQSKILLRHWEITFLSFLRIRVSNMSMINW